MILTVPKDRSYFPTLGPLVARFIEDHLIFGPGDLRGQPAVLDDEKLGLIYRIYEVFPQTHPLAGRRRFKRVGLSLPKGLAKTEFAAWIAACELHHAAPVRCIGWTKKGEPIGGPVTDPYIPLVAYTEEQSDELCYGALRVILEEGPLRDDFDIGLERILRKKGDGKAVSLSSSPSARDGARTTFAVMDEPLAIDTPIITTAGWKSIGEITEGDFVYGREGLAVRVLGGSAIHHGRPCYRVTFSEGDSIVTDEGHRWKVTSLTNPEQERIVTTREMFDAGVDTGYGKRWRLPRHAGFDGVETDLPIDPYVFGLWLGDGDSRNATICSGDGDVFETRRLIEACGYRVTLCKVTGGRAPVLYVTLPDAQFSGWQVVNGEPSVARSVVGHLRGLGVLKRKHIPRAYMFASRAQRLALLQGLMDSDGHATKQGTCTFAQSKREIADQVADLVRSLGTPARVVERADPRARSGFGYKVNFTPNYPAFRLTRKAERWAAGRFGPALLPTIVSIAPCESVPVRCIAVESDDHLFLAGRGLRLTHNTHWWTSPRLKQAHQTMSNNLAKRKIADPWMMETTTAPEPGSGSVAEATMEYAEAVVDGRVQDASLFFFHRQAGDEHDLTTKEGVRAAVIEASGAAAAWRDIDAIVGLLDDPNTDRAFWERVWCNRLVKGSSQAFDVEQWKTLAIAVSPVKPRALIALGFDGAIFHDSTSLVATDVVSGYQWIAGLWERPVHVDEWQVPADEVDATVRDYFDRYDVIRMYADPPYWDSWLSLWVGLFGKERVMQWFTNSRNRMASALENYETAIKEGKLSHDGDPRLARHLANARRKNLDGFRSEEGRPLWLIQKERPDSLKKIDAAMAAVLSWEARIDAIAAGALIQPSYQLVILGQR